MNEIDTSIEREAISFFPNLSYVNLKSLEIKFTISGPTFKIQLSVFKEVTPEELLHLLQEFSQTKTKFRHTIYSKFESGLELVQGNARNEWV